MEKTITEKLRCINYKGDLNNGVYNAISPRENDYEIDEGILYISYDGRNVIEVPGDFSNIEEFKKNAYQINRRKNFCISKISKIILNIFKYYGSNLANNRITR